MSQQFKTAKCYIVYDENAIAKPGEDFFRLSYWAEKDGYESLSGGRGGSCLFSLDGRQYVLRRYYRGGLVAKIMKESYLWTGLNSTRPWREWNVLHTETAQTLPVMRPVAAFVESDGYFFYRAAIISEYLPNTETLAHRLSHSVMSSEMWVKLGVQIKRIQSANIRHADLNANNILIDQNNNFYVIDFDKSIIMPHLSDWQWMPLHRLQRSLDKIQRTIPLRYNENDWQSLMDGYQV